MVLRLIYYRGAGGFKKRFSLTQDGSNFDITLLAAPVITWHFRKIATDKKTIVDDGVPTGVNNHVVGFDVPTNFFDACKVWSCTIEVKDGGLIVHSEERFEVEVKEPAGLTTDP